MTKIIQRHDTSTNWTSINPVLALGEMGIETDTNKFKFGDGVTNWTSLSYASAEGGGGGADLSNYYTKEETYNQEEIDNLLDKKQDVLNATLPIEIGSKTIGGPYNITTTNGYVIATYGGNPNVSVSTVDNVVLLYNSSLTNYPTTIEQVCSGNCSYFDIPIDMATQMQKVDNGELSSISAKIKLSGFTSNANTVAFLAGHLGEDGFEPLSLATPRASTSYIGSTIVDSSVASKSSNGVKMVSTIKSYNTSGGSSSADPQINYIIIYNPSNSVYRFRTEYYSGSATYYSQNSFNTTTATTYDIVARMRKINVVRVFWYGTYTGSTSYAPTVDKITLSYNNVDTGWRITDGAVTTYGVSLKYDNQTIQVNSDGELVANLDELGNEVNTLAGRVTSVETGLTDKADKTGVDGQYVVSELYLASDASTDTTDTVYDLASYLPDDDYIYDVLFTGYCIPTDAKHKLSTILLTTDIIHNSIFVCASRCEVAGVEPLAYGSIWLPVGSGRKAIVSPNPSSYFDGTYNLRVEGYRRVGTNE